MEIYFSTEPVDAIIRNAYIAVLFFNSTLRGVVLCLNRFGFEHVMETVRLLYIELKVSDVWLVNLEEIYYENLNFCLF